MRLFIISLILVTSDAWDNSFLLPNIPIDLWTHVSNYVLIEEWENKSFLDIGCGLGFSTSKTPGSLGIDSSRENIEKAKVLFPEKDFQLGVVSSWKDKKTYNNRSLELRLRGRPDGQETAHGSASWQIDDLGVLDVEVDPRLRAVHWAVACVC